MTGTFQDYRDDDDVCEAYVATSGQAPRPTVLIAHQWAGQSDHERATADRLAALGFTGIAIDVYGRGRRGDASADNSALMQPWMQDRAALRRRLLAAVAFAKELDSVDASRIAVIGYCFGGLCALDVARSATADVRGAISLHGIFARPDIGAQPPIVASVLVLHGWEDPLAPPSDVEGLARELTDAGADWQLHAYGHAMHAFTGRHADSPERGLKYDAKADARSWATMIGFLKEILV